jgi:hypothetical protein
VQTSKGAYEKTQFELEAQSLLNVLNIDLEEQPQAQRSMLHCKGVLDHGAQWSTLKFPKEKPTASDFRLWREAICRVVPVEGLAVRLGRCLHRGYKVWDWRVSAEHGCLLNYKEDSMDVYQLVPRWRRQGHLTQAGCEIEIIGRPCSVRELQGGRKITTSVSPAVDEVLAPQTILDVIKGWKQSWFWRKLEFIGDLDWLRDSIAEGSVLEGWQMAPLYGSSFPTPTLAHLC